MDETYSKIVERIVSENEGIKPKAGYELFIQIFGQMREEVIKEAGEVTEAQVKSKISALKRVLLKKNDSLNGSNGLTWILKPIFFDLEANMYMK